MAETLEDADRSIAAAKAAGLPLQVGFNRRFGRTFREAHDVIAAGGIGTPQLLRSLTRDPGLANPRGGAPLDNLHPDSHSRLRCPQLAEPRCRAGRSVRN